MADINIIYEKSTVQLASVGLAQAHPNKYSGLYKNMSGDSHHVYVTLIVALTTLNIL